MKTTRIISLAVVATLAASLPAGAGPRRPKPAAFTDCVDQGASLLIPQAQAQAYVPEGFTATGGPADQQNLVHAFVGSVTCGGAKPTLEWSETYVSVDPPAEIQGPTTAEFFLLDFGSSGVAGARLRKLLCLGSALEDAQIERTPVADPPSDAVSGVTKIASPSLNVTFSVATAGTASDGVGRYRWYFRNDAGQIDYFDTIESQRFVAMGSGAIVHSAPYRDLPLASPSLALVKLKDATYYPSTSCQQQTSG